MMAAPWTRGKLSHKEPYHNLDNPEMITVCAESCSGRSILVFDSHYMDITGKILYYYFFKKKLLLLFLVFLIIFSTLLF
jgi:hypothetical protein